MNKLENSVIKYQIDFENKKADGGAVFEFRIVCGRSFLTRADAEKCLKTVGDMASNPRIIQGASGAWLVVLYESNSRKRIEHGYWHYKTLGLEVFIQTV